MVKREAGAGSSPGPSSQPGAPVPELGWAPPAIHSHQPWHVDPLLGEESAVLLTAALTDGLHLARVRAEPLTGLREQQGVWGQHQGQSRAQGVRRLPRRQAHPGAARCRAGLWGGPGAADTGPGAPLGRVRQLRPWLLITASHICVLRGPQGLRMRDLALVGMCPPPP